MCTLHFFNHWCRSQEEIRFSVCPELIASMLLMEEMADNEAVLIQGFETYAQYQGYAKTLQFTGAHKDPVQVWHSYYVIWKILTFWRKNFFLLDPKLTVMTARYEISNLICYSNSIWSSFKVSRWDIQCDFVFHHQTFLHMNIFWFWRHQSGETWSLVGIFFSNQTESAWQIMNPFYPT